MSKPKTPALWVALVVESDGNIVPFGLFDRRIDARNKAVRLAVRSDRWHGAARVVLPAAAVRAIAGKSDSRLMRRKE